MPSRKDRSVSLLDSQRKAVERLKDSLFGADPYVRRRYIQDYHREFRSYSARISREELERVCLRSDIVFVGDYHALPSCQNFAAELLESLARGNRPVVLFLEMIFSRDQRALDRYLQGEIGEASLRRAIRYDREWGYPWDGYGRLLRAAREAGVPVVAADAPPRGGLRLIRLRDRHAARMIRSRLEATPRSRAVVLFGESHMASRHLPREVASELGQAGLDLSSIVIVQNVEEIYWDLAEKGEEMADAVRISARRYAVLNASPLAKYEAYRQTIIRWAQQADEEPDFLPSVHHLIELLAGFLSLDPYRTPVRQRDGARALLVDLYPEVVTRRVRRRSGGARHPLPRRARGGVVYIQGANRIEVHAFSIAAAAEAAARFLMAALRNAAGTRPGSGRSIRTTDGAGKAAAGIAQRIIDEAFLAFSVRYLDPTALVPQRRSSRVPEAGRIRADSGPGEIARIAMLARGGGGVASVRDARGLVRQAGRIGAALGIAVYTRSRKRGVDLAARSWLTRVARCRAQERLAGRPGPIDLLIEGAKQVGWLRR